MGGWAAYVLSTVWFSVGDYCHLLLCFARLLPDHLRGCHATEPPCDQNPILPADANVTYQARLSTERCFPGGYCCNARRGSLELHHSWLGIAAVARHRWDSVLGRRLARTVRYLVLLVSPADSYPVF